MIAVSALSTMMLLLQDEYGTTGGGAGAAMGGLFMLVWLAVMAVIIAAGWKIYVKAGQPGWAFLVPIYGIVVLLKIVGRPVWWLLILPLGIPAIIVCIDLAKKFGKGTGFGLGLAFLSPIFVPVLAFGDARYQG